MSEYHCALGEALRRVRLACGYSQYAVAQALGISRSAYTYYELGKTSPDVESLVKLARIFTVPVDVFIRPEEYGEISPNRIRAPKKPAVDPERIGELRAEEKAYIAKWRKEGRRPD